MKIVCNYHPTKPAHWFCEKCGANLCPECVTRRDQEGSARGQKLHLCPKCFLPVEWIGVGNLIDPFWKRLPKIFAYGFYPQPLIFLIVISAVATLFSQPGLFNFAVLMMFALMIFKYSFETLKTSASGDLKPPKISTRTISADMGQVMKQAVIFIIIGVAEVYLAKLFGPFVLRPADFIISLFVPAMIMILVSSGSLLNAINPIAFVTLVFRIGWGYLLMFVFLYFLRQAPLLLGSLVLQHVPPTFHTSLIMFVVGFYTIISYHLMGYVILQYHEEIGYEVDQDDFRDPTVAEAGPGQVDPDSHVLNAVNPLIQEGKLDEAIALIIEMTAVTGIQGIKLSERYYTLLKMKKKIPQLLEHAGYYLDMLAADNKKTQALRVYIECRKIKTDFLPNASSLFKLAGWLNEMGKSKEAIATYNRLVKEYPDHRLVPKAFFRVAQIFQDRLMSPDNARKILTGVKNKYPDNEIIPHVDNFLANLG
jgi:B-box zinc finger/Tetratricopeptide repeat